MTEDLIRPGDIVVLHQDRGKRYVIRVSEGSVYMTVGGFIRASDIIGLPPGSRVRSSAGREYIVLRAGAIEQLELMERRSQVIYPKDLAYTAALIDVRPCISMLQSGVGTGYSLLFFARLIGGCGRVVGYEVRGDMASIARENMERLGYSNVEIVRGDIYRDPVEGSFDAALLDLPDPARALENIYGSMKPGSRIAVFLPTISQVERLRAQLGRPGKYAWLGSYEVHIREWRVEPGMTRPLNTPSSHTGFITLLARIE